MFHQFGLSLLEALISSVILSIMLLGMDAMLITSLHKSIASYYAEIAAQQIRVMTEQLQLPQINLEAAITTWNKQNETILPQGKGVVQKNQIVIYWGGKNETTCKTTTFGKQGCLYQILDFFPNSLL